MSSERVNRYSAIIGKIFGRHYRSGDSEFEFSRNEFVEIAESLGIAVPKNLGDAIYSFRFRRALPEAILATAPEGLEWGIELAGRGRYRFRLAPPNRIVPGANLLAIKIPDATPEIISSYALSDEQAVLARIRYNRLIDIFLGITTYSLQNHLRTTVTGIGQIEIDEIYVGLNRNGAHFVIPVQAKGGSDQLGSTQTRQDLACCQQKFPELICRPVSAQFMADDVIALFELTVERDSGEVRIVDEKHYRLTPSSEIGEQDLRSYAQR